MADDRHAAFLRLVGELNARHLIDVPGVRELWLIRHADAYAGLSSLDEGPLDPPLSARGREQTARLAARLATVPLHAVWSSDLRRARQTAEEIVRGRPLEVRFDSRLREVRTYWDEGRLETQETSDAYPFPEPEAAVGERMTAAVRDVVAGLDEVRERTPRAAVVSHNAAIAIYVGGLLGLGWGKLRVMPNFTSVTVVAVKGDQLVVQSIADATHLVAPPD